jgi:hypothetical protein
MKAEIVKVFVRSTDNSAIAGNLHAFSKSLVVLSSCRYVIVSVVCRILKRVDYESSEEEGVLA